MSKLYLAGNKVRRTWMNQRLVGNTIIAEFIWCNLNEEHFIDFKGWVNNDEAMRVLVLFQEHKVKSLKA